MKDKITGLCDKLKSTLINKNADYGNSALETPILCPELKAGDAIRVRMSDKIKRIITLENREASVHDESLEDTYLDLAGYAILKIISMQDS